MGASEFVTVSKGKDAKTAFAAAKQNARYDYGHRGYTGTVAEKQDLVMMGRASSEAEAEKMARTFLYEGDKRIDDKWGPAGCIEVEGKEREAKTFVFFGWASS